MTTQTRNSILIVLGILVILIAGWKALTLFAGRNRNQNNDPKPDANGKGTPSPTALKKDVVLSKGSKGKEVSELQKLMNAMLYEAELSDLLEIGEYQPLNIDGDFGNKTQKRMYLLWGETKISLATASIKPMNISEGVDDNKVDQENSDEVWYDFSNWELPDWMTGGGYF